MNSRPTLDPACTAGAGLGGSWTGLQAGSSWFAGLHVHSPFGVRVFVSFKTTMCSVLEPYRVRVLQCSSSVQLQATTQLQVLPTAANGKLASCS